MNNISLRGEVKKPRPISQRVKASYHAILCLTTLFCVPPSARSQDKNIAFEHFDVDQGMSGGSVPCIYQDHIGYLWFGTYFGVDRYDGYSFTSYRHDPENPSSLVDAFVETLYEDRAGNIWVGTQNGFDTLDRATGKFTHFLPHPPGPGTERSNFLHAFHEDKDGILWIGTDDGLISFDRSKAKRTCFRDDSTDLGFPGYNAIRTICEDTTGSFWIGTGRGLNKFDRKSGKFIHCWHDFIHMNRWGNWISSIYQDDSGILWLGGGAGLVAFDQRTGTFTQYRHHPNDPRSLSIDEVSSISGDNDGKLWVGTYSQGLNVFDKKTKSFTHYVHNDKDPGSLSSNSIQSAYCERSGTIWVSTIDAGVNKLNRTKPLFTNYLYEDFNPYSTFPEVVDDNADKLWIRTTNEWKKFDPTTETFIGLPLEKGSYPLLEDRAGNLWIGKVSGGLYKRDHQGQIGILHDSSGLKFRRVAYCLTESHDGSFWMGTEDGGFFAVDPATNTVALIQQGPNQINNIYEDQFGLLWAGTWGSGLMCYDPVRETVVWYTSDPHNPASLSGNTSVTMHEDKTGTLWIGTNIGLNRYDRASATFTHLTVKDGLPNDVVSKILEDDHGGLWLGTMMGISRFDPKTKRFRNYGISSGLVDNALRGACRTRNGEMYFCGQHGLTRFHPDSIRDNPYIPPIVVTQFRLFEKPTPFSNEVNLSYRDNFISFEFASLSYLSPERNQYAYKMEGIDPEWVISGTRRYAGYPHLEPGEYVFRVKGSNNDGVWNEEGISIAVIITPPFWATWWFRGFAFVAMLVSVGGGIRYVEMRKLKRKIEMLEQERALERERTRISQDMHDEVGAGLTEIGILSELAKRNIQNPGEAEMHMQRVSETSRETIASIGEIIWAINPKNGSLDDLVAYVRHYAARYLGSTPHKLHFEIPETIPALRLSAEARRSIFLVVKEAIHNIVKHSRATAVCIKVSFRQECLEIQVQDNGKGFTAGELSRFGNGLRNMEKRMTCIGGTFEIESQPGRGTRVVISAGV